jgi:hypothetical protein
VVRQEVWHPGSGPEPISHGLAAVERDSIVTPEQFDAGLDTVLAGLEHRLATMRSSPAQDR